MADWPTDVWTCRAMAGDRLSSAQVQDSAGQLRSGRLGAGRVGRQAGRHNGDGNEDGTLRTHSAPSSSYMSRRTAGGSPDGCDGHADDDVHGGCGQPLTLAPMPLTLSSLLAHSLPCRARMCMWGESKGEETKEKRKEKREKRKTGKREMKKGNGGLRQARLRWCLFLRLDSALELATTIHSEHL